MRDGGGVLLIDASITVRVDAGRGLEVAARDRLDLVAVPVEDLRGDRNHIRCRAHAVAVVAASAG